MTDEAQAAAPASAEDISAALLTDQPIEQPKPEPEDPPVDDAAAAAAAEASKPKQTAQERIDDITRERHAERRRADEAERREQALLDRLGKQSPAPAPQTPSPDDEPKPEKYEFGDLDANFIRDHATFHARKAFREEQAKSDAERSRTTALQKFDARADEIASKHDDFFDVVGPNFAKAVALGTPNMNQAIVESDLGPDLAYHLAKNPAEARRIAALSPISQVREIGRLEARLSEPSAPKAKTATDAPPATPQVRGTGGQFKVAADTADFASFEKAYP